MSKYVLIVPDISCNHCKMRISKVLTEIGEEKFEIDVAQKTVTIETENIELVSSKLAEIEYPVSEIREIK
ncbi:MAG: heavy-metal-associated domain-containing protein [Fervidobacterium sp.]